MNCRVLMFAAAIALPGAAQPPDWLTLHEAQWREQVLPLIESEQAVTTADRAAKWYVKGLASRLAHAASEPENGDYRFILYDDRVGLNLPWFGPLKNTTHVNALPGGIVLVPESLFEVSADEDEFAAAIARGIAHVMLKHFRRTAARGSIVRPIPPADRRLELYWQPYPKTLMFSRAFEAEADVAAMAILAGAGFDPSGLKRHVSNARASFDASDSRLRKVELALAKLQPRTTCPGDNRRFDELKVRLAGRAVV